MSTIPRCSKVSPAKHCRYRSPNFLFSERPFSRLQREEVCTYLWMCQRIKCYITAAKLHIFWVIIVWKLPKDKQTYSFNVIQVSLCMVTINGVPTNCPNDKIRHAVSLFFPLRAERQTGINILVEDFSVKSKTSTKTSFWESCYNISLSDIFHTKIWLYK